MVGKKNYKEFEAEINKEVELKMKTHLAGFTSYIEKNTFSKEDK
jgi:hypothetical protein